MYVSSECFFCMFVNRDRSYFFFVILAASLGGVKHNYMYLLISLALHLNLAKYYSIQFYSGTGSDINI